MKMDAVKFTRAAMRMCNDYYSKCWSCPAGDNTSCKLDSSYSAISAEEKVAIVEQWAERHPAKTRQNEFLEHYPNTRIAPDGMISISPCLIEPQNYPISGDDCESTPCDICRRKFWLAEVDG